MAVILVGTIIIYYKRKGVLLATVLLNNVYAAGCINDNEVPVCSEGNSRMCLNRTSVCDGSVDCANGLDEGNCSGKYQ